MPVRSLSSSILRWPDRGQVSRALARWVALEASKHPNLLRLGYFGSYVRGDNGVGSDLNLLAVIESSNEAFERRALSWDLLPLPVPAEILVYTQEEWDRLISEDSRFARTLQKEARWLVPEDPREPVLSSAP